MTTLRQRSLLTRVGGVLAVAITLGAAFVVPSSAQAAGPCPRGWIQRAVWNEGSFHVYVFRSPDNIRVVGKVVNHGATPVDAQADHGDALLGRTVVATGQSWCSNTSPLPITVWATPVTNPSWGFPHTYPAGAAHSGPN